MYDFTAKALEIIFKKEYNLNTPFSSLSGLVPRNQLITAEKGQTFICQKDPVKYLYVLIKGRAAVLNHIIWNNDNIIDYVESLEILGLVEYLNSMNVYTAYVVAETKCIMLRIPVEIFSHIIQENAFLCYQALLILGKVTESNMNRAETNSTFHPKDQLGHYLFLQAKHVTPYICPMSRMDLSEYLHINLRTLYRYIDFMEENGFLTLRKGKIVIEAEHLRKLTERYGDVIL